MRSPSAVPTRSRSRYDTAHPGLSPARRTSRPRRRSPPRPRRPGPVDRVPWHRPAAPLDPNTRSNHPPSSCPRRPVAVPIAMAAAGTPAGEAWARPARWLAAHRPRVGLAGTRTGPRRHRRCDGPPPAPRPRSPGASPGPVGDPPRRSSISRRPADGPVRRARAGSWTSAAPWPTSRGSRPARPPTPCARPSAPTTSSATASTAPRRRPTRAASPRRRSASTPRSGPPATGPGARTRPRPPPARG